jgi:hypothetical protein
MAQSNQGSKARSWSTKQLGWTCAISLAVGAIVTYQAGFNYVGAWETGTEVQRKMAVSACVKEFLLQPNRGVIYASLMDTNSSYQRGKVLQEHKLASGSSVAKECGDEISSFDAAMFPAA